jgi:hypothetical protein
MKKGSVFVVLFLILIKGGLWAQLISNTVVYDTIVQTPKYSYSIGLVSSMEVLNMQYGINDPLTNVNSEWAAEYSSFGGGAFFQVEWRYFIFGINGGYAHLNLQSDRNEKEFYKILNIDAPIDKHTYKINAQFLGRLPLVEKDFGLSLFLGPELATNIHVGVNVLAGFDMGFKLTSHHSLVLGASAGIPVFPFLEPLGYSALYNQLDGSRDGSRIKSTAFTGIPIYFQIFLGIRTVVTENIYYYGGHEVARGR